MILEYSFHNDVLVGPDNSPKAAYYLQLRHRRANVQVRRFSEEDQTVDITPEYMLPLYSAQLRMFSDSNQHAKVTMVPKLEALPPVVTSKDGSTMHMIDSETYYTLGPQRRGMQKRFFLMGLKPEGIVVEKVYTWTGRRR